MKRNNFRIFHFIAIITVVIFSFIRDYHYTQQYPNDLRNRVVGSRLQADGMLPYYYHWQNGDSLRYYNYSNFNEFSVSNITATPFYHSAFRPVANLSQHSIAFLQLGFNYLLLLAMLIVTATFSQQFRGKHLLACLYLLAAFTLTESWRMMIYLGQYYLLIAFLLFAFVWTLLRIKPSLDVTGGIICSMLVLIRPTALVVLLPAFWLCRKRPFFLFGSAGFLLLYGLFVVSNYFQLQLWTDYFAAIPQHALYHLGFTPTPASYAAVPAIPILEGFNMAEVEQLRLENPVSFSGQNTNLYYYVGLLTSYKPSYAFCQAMLLIVCGSYLGILWLKRRQWSMAQCLNWICLLFLTTDYVAPVLRGAYVGVIWMPLMVLCCRSSRQPFVYLLLFLGMVISLLPTGIFPVNHVLAEFCWYLACLLSIWKYHEMDRPPIAFS